MKIILIWAAMLLFAAGSVLAGGNGAQQEKPYLSFKEIPEFRIQRGEVLYKRYCLFCHGEYGAGDGMNAYTLPTKPGNFLDDDFRQETTQAVQEIIAEGGEGSGRDKAMPAFGNTLPSKNINDLATYIQSIKPPDTAADTDDGDDLL
jgi:mono/diheme cytochrome c family protein